MTKGWDRIQMERFTSSVCLSLSHVLEALMTTHLLGYGGKLQINI